MSLANKSCDYFRLIPLLPEFANFKRILFAPSERLPLANRAGYYLRVKRSLGTKMLSIGTLIVPIGMLLLSGFSFAFGWAKPVPITEQNLPKPRRDMAPVAVAGPYV